MKALIKYKVGDWVRSIDIISEVGPLVLITRTYRINGEPHYDVEFYLNEFTESGLKHVGNESDVGGNRIILLTDPRDILLCLASDIQKKQHEASQNAEKLAKDVEALVRSRELLGR